MWKRLHNCVPVKWPSFFTFNNIFHKTHATLDTEKLKPLYKLILWKHSRSKEYLFIWTQIFTVFNYSEIYVTSIDLFWSTMDMGLKCISSSLFSIPNHARIFSMQLAYGLSLRDVKHNLNILWMIAQMAFEANIIRFRTKSLGFSVYLCIMNINIK